jgi:hypothetical protein
MDCLIVVSKSTASKAGGQGSSNLMDIEKGKSSESVSNISA